MRKHGRYEDWKARQMEDPEFRAAKKALEPAYQVARLRIRQGLTQGELAKLVNTKQSSIARLESGRSEPSLSFLRRVVEALGGRLEVQIVAPETAQVLEPSQAQRIQKESFPSAELVYQPGPALSTQARSRSHVFSMSEQPSEVFDREIFNWNSPASKTFNLEVSPA